jgi:hypothetical protein
VADGPNPDGLIASRLEHLFRTVHPAHWGPYTPGDVATAINRPGRGGSWIVRALPQGNQRLVDSARSLQVQPPTRRSRQADDIE